MTSKKQPTYQQTSQALDELLAKLQQPDIHVDEAAQLYEAGLQLIQQLEVQLQQAENTIQRLKVAPAGEGQ
jgi:exodeoxyribonuclease VII small subunit